MRLLAKAAILAGATLALSGCGSDLTGDEPDAQTVEDEMELHTFTLPDGQKIDCVLFTENGEYTSWLAFDCDWNPDG